jgi:hypothetical protein
MPKLLGELQVDGGSVRSTITASIGIAAAVRILCVRVDLQIRLSAEPLVRGPASR